MKLYKQLQLLPNQRADLAALWHAWCMRRKTLDFKQHAAVCSLNAMFARLVPSSQIGTLMAFLKSFDEVIVEQTEPAGTQAGGDTKSCHAYSESAHDSFGCDETAVGSGHLIELRKGPIKGFQKYCCAYCCVTDGAQCIDQADRSSLDLSHVDCKQLARAVTDSRQGQYSSHRGSRYGSGLRQDGFHDLYASGRLVFEFPGCKGCMVVDPRWPPASSLWGFKDAAHSTGSNAWSCTATQQCDAPIAHADSAKEETCVRQLHASTGHRCSRQTAASRGARSSSSFELCANDVSAEMHGGEGCSTSRHSAVCFACCAPCCSGMAHSRHMASEGWHNPSSVRCGACCAPCCARRCRHECMHTAQCAASCAHDCLPGQENGMTKRAGACVHIASSCSDKGCCRQAAGCLHGLLRPTFLGQSGGVMEGVEEALRALKDVHMSDGHMHREFLVPYVELTEVPSSWFSGNKTPAMLCLHKITVCFSDRRVCILFTAVPRVRIQNWLTPHYSCEQCTAVCRCRMHWFWVPRSTLACRPQT